MARPNWVPLEELMFDHSGTPFPSFFIKETLTMKDEEFGQFFEAVKQVVEVRIIRNFNRNGLTGKAEKQLFLLH